MRDVRGDVRLFPLHWATLHYNYIALHCYIALDYIGLQIHWVILHYNYIGLHLDTFGYNYIGEKNIGSRIRRIRMIEYNARLTISVKTFTELNIISAND